MRSFLEDFERFDGRHDGEEVEEDTAQVFVPKDVFPRCVDGRSRRRLRRPVRHSHEGRLGQVHR